jgi:hypothetical protein
MRKQPRVTQRKWESLREIQGVGKKEKKEKEKKGALRRRHCITCPVLLSRGCDDGSERQRRRVSGVMFLHSVPMTTARKAEVAREARRLRGTTFSRLFASEHRLQRLEI